MVETSPVILRPGMWVTMKNTGSRFTLRDDFEAAGCATT